MRILIGTLVGAACLVVITAGGLWLWQQVQHYQAEQTQAQGATETFLESVKAEASSASAAAQCASYVDVLQQAEAAPQTVTAAEKDAAAEGYIDCR